MIDVLWIFAQRLAVIALEAVILWRLDAPRWGVGAVALLTWFIFTANPTVLP